MVALKFLLLFIFSLEEDNCLSLLSFMTALAESSPSMSIHNVFSWPISTFLHFSQIGKPVLDSHQKLRATSSVISIVLGGPLLGNCDEPSQCRVRADCHGGHRTCLCRVLDHHFLAIHYCATPTQCRVPSRLRQLSRLSQHSGGHVRGNLSLRLSM